MGRGLKLGKTKLNFTELSEVAPVGAWIEIIATAFCAARKSEVAPVGAWIEISNATSNYTGTVKSPLLGRGLKFHILQ